MAFNCVPVNATTLETEPIAIKEGAIVDEEVDSNINPSAEESSREEYIEDGILKDASFNYESDFEETIEESDTSTGVEQTQPEETNFPSFDQDIEIDNILISISAPEGVIPEGAFVSVKKIILEDRNFLQQLLNINSSDDEIRVDQEEVNKIENAVEDVRPEYKNVVQWSEFS